MTVSIGVPALVLIGIPLIDNNYTNWAITSFGLNIAAFAFGCGITVDASKGLIPGLIDLGAQFEKGIQMFPYRAMLFSVLCTAVTASFSFLLIRQATVKE